MSTALAKTLGMKTELICLGFALLSTAACAPMSFVDANQAAALQQGVSPISSGEIADGPAQVISGGQPTQPSAPVAVTPSATPIIDDRPFAATIQLPKCTDITQDSLAFELISGADSKVVSGQITSLPTVNNQMDYQSYSAYAVFQGDGTLEGDQAYLEVKIDNQRAYGFFNCNLQTLIIDDLAKAMKVPWVNVAPRATIHFLMPETSLKPVGIALKNQHTQQVTLRCFK
ncbi:MAG: hypothetical protein ACKOX6_04985 [Bdellovibrio sp.]